LDSGTVVDRKFLVELGSTVSVAAGVNWAVAWLIWTRRPSVPERGES
jgi:hypothetical protein